MRKNLNQFAVNSSFHKYNTRAGAKLRDRRHTLSLHKTGVYSRGVQLYNALPDQFRSPSLSIETFVGKVKQLLVEASCYTVQEYVNFVKEYKC